MARGIGHRDGGISDPQTQAEKLKPGADVGCGARALIPASDFAQVLLGLVDVGVVQVQRTRLGVGKSEASRVREAAREAVAGARRASGAVTFGLVFSTDQYGADELATAISAELEGVPWAGCCTAGVFDGQTLSRQGVVVGLFEGTRASVGLGGPVSEAPRRAGRSAVEAALDGLGEAGRPRAIILLSDALTGSTSEVVRGAVDEAGSGVAWAGGGSGDNLRFVRTAQFAGGRAWSDRVVAIALDVDAPIGVGIRHGWRPYGPPTMVTRARGSEAVELEYEPAFEVYRRTVADRGAEVSLTSFASFAMTHPLGIPQAGGEHVIRDPLSVGPDGALRCVGEVPSGALVRIMEGDRSALLEAARGAAVDATSSVGEVSGAIVFDCVSRSILMGEHVGEELAAFRAGLGPGAPIMGCLTFGEVGAFGSGVPQFHNKTSVLLALPK
ncbi:MAG: FIST C-terminal domain-containing protein [Deltaproteobacteria bacterium]|nr:FIST C-terminal domain-containing protein [Deltaproteobacteria bacterium]